MQKGKIHFKKRAAQFNDFSGVRYGNMTPTDIDGHLEYQNRLHIFLEGKYEGAPHPYGQQLAQERLNDDVAQTKPCLTVVYNHQYPAEMDVPVAECFVEKFYRNRKWHKPEKDTCVKELCDEFIQKTTIASFYDHQSTMIGVKEK